MSEYFTPYALRRAWLMGLTVQGGGGVGPQGPPGPAGATGAQGPPGPASGPNFYVGSVTLAANQPSGTVNGLALAWVPTVVIPSVSIPVGGLKINAWDVQGTLTADGFNYVLDGLPPDNTYILNFVIYE